MPEDQGNSGVKFKIPWLSFMRQDEFKSGDFEKFEVSQTTQLQTSLLEISLIFVLKWSNSQAKLIWGQNSLLVLSMELPW